MDWLSEILVLLAWAFVPPIVLLCLWCLQRPQWQYKATMLVVFVLWLPFFGLPLGWKPLMDLMGLSEVREAINVSSYRVEFITGQGPLERDRYFLVTSTDGEQARWTIDGDANACRNLTTQRDGPRILFLCAGEEKPSYVDTEQLALSPGVFTEGTQIESLFIEVRATTAMPWLRRSSVRPRRRRNMGLVGDPQDTTTNRTIAVNALHGIHVGRMARRKRDRKLMVCWT